MAQRTQDMQKIKEWVEDRNGHPSIVKGTEDMLRIDFESNGNDEDLEHIGWDRFEEVFKNNNLTFLYEDSDDSRFFKFVSE